MTERAEHRAAPKPARMPSGDRPRYAADEGQSVPDDIARHLVHLEVERRLAARTLAMYGEAFSAAAQRCARGDAGGTARGADPPCAPLGGPDALRKGLAPRSIAIVLSAWRGFYRWLGRDGLVALNPVDGVRAPKSGKPLPKALVGGPGGVAGRSPPGCGRRGRPAAWKRATTASWNCCTAAACAWASWSGLDRQAGARRPQAGSTPPMPRRTCSARAASGAACRWVSPALQSLAALARTARSDGAAKADEPALFVSNRGTRLTPSQVRSRLKRRAHAGRS